MSIYDNIETAADLIAEVAANGLSTLQDDINRAADIIGHTGIHELIRLANDIGRNNENGEPDPNGSWSSSRKPTQSTFYSIVSHIWNWEEVTRFWNQHTNPEHQELKASKESLKDLNNQLDAMSTLRDLLHRFSIEDRERIRELSNEATAATNRADKAEAEVMALKAKLYDFMCNKAS